MKIKHFLFVLIAFVCLLNSCKGNEPEPPIIDEGYKAPDAPATVNQANVFSVEFFSRLTDETLFQSPNYDVVNSHIMANHTPLAFIFDRSDATIGQTSPVVDIAWQTKTRTFFVQNQNGENQIQGSGIIVRPLINSFDGVRIVDSLYMSGCTLSAPCSKVIVVTLLTCKISNNYQFVLLTKSLGDGLKTNKILIGTIENSLEMGFIDYLKLHLKNFRLAFYTSNQSGKTYEIFFLTPIEFVSRETIEQTVGEIPMYQCKLEYLD